MIHDILYFQILLLLSMPLKQSSNHPLSLQDSGTSFNNKQLVRDTLVGCQKANFQLALSNINKLSNRYHNDEQVSFNVDVQYFKKYGSGIYLFFAFAKRLSICFILVAIIYLIPILYNYYIGDGFSNESMSSTGITLAKTSIANFNINCTQKSTLDVQTSKKHKIANAIPDIFVSFLFLGFYLYWEFKSDNMTQQMKQTTNFQAYKTLELVDFPKTATQQEIQTFFSQFGTVKEISAVKNYSQIISYCKQIYEIEEQKKTLEIILEKVKDEEQKQDLNRQISQMASQITSLENEAISYHQQVKEQVVKYYIVFANPVQRQQALKAMKNNGKNEMQNEVSQSYQINGQDITVIPCHDEPGEIIWQNQNVSIPSRLVRWILQSLLLILILFVAFVVISILNLATPPTSSNLNTSAFDLSTVAAQNTTIQYYWCLYHQGSRDQDIYNFCKPFISKYYVSVFIGILITLLIVIVKKLLKFTVIKLAHFQRYKSYTQQSGDIMKNLFFCYTFSTVLITLLLQAKIFNASFKEFIILNFANNSSLKENAILLTDYDDFKPYWFVQIGYKIFLITIIQALQGPIVNPIISFIMEKIRYCQASSKLTQKSMETALKIDQFELEDHYANILFILYIGLTFSAGMPIIMFACAIGFVLRYFYFKLTFIRFSCIPKSIDENLNQTMINMLPFALLLHFGFAIWMYGSKYLFSDITNFFGQQSDDNQFLTRLSNSWYYSLMFFLCALIVILKMIFYDLIYETRQQERNNDKIPTQIIKAVTQKVIGKSTNMIKVMAIKNIDDVSDKLSVEQNLQSTTIPQLKNKRSKISKAIAITNSYKMENNPDYFQVMAIMRRIQDKCKGNQP